MNEGLEMAYEIPTGFEDSILSKESRQEESLSLHLHVKWNRRANGYRLPSLYQTE